MSTLTGRTRYRTGWFGWMVLQVEFLDRRYSEEGEYRWRDASPNDFATPEMRTMFRDAPMPFPGQRPITER